MRKRIFDEMVSEAAGSLESMPMVDAVVFDWRVQAAGGRRDVCEDTSPWCCIGDLRGMQHAARACLPVGRTRCGQRQPLHVHTPCITRGGQHDGAVRRRARTRFRTCLCMPV